MTYFEKLNNCLKAVRAKNDFVPEIALILGSGLGGLADEIDTVCTVGYGEIPDFPISTVEGHAGKFVFGFLEGVPVVIMQGRVHYYEGYDMQDVVLPTRLMGMLGAKVLFLTNAAGGINPDFASGALMAINDHFSALVPSPLRGANIDELGVRFPDMSSVYNKKLLSVMHSAADSLGIKLFDGVYVQTSGPNYETPFEIKVYASWGCDAVGMSTACEAMAANHMGLKVCAISCITNLAAGISKAPLTHAEVKETADRVSGQFKALVRRTVRDIYAQIDTL